MSTQSIHRATRTMPNPVRFAIFDYCGLTVLACDRQTVAVNYGPVTLSAATNSICRVPLLPSLQIGGRLMSRVAASAPIQ